MLNRCLGLAGALGLALLLAFSGDPARAGEVEIVSRLDPSHESDTRSNTGSLFGGSPCLSMSGDGRYTVFSSDANNLMAGQVDTNQGQDVFLYDRVSGLTSLVSHVIGASTKTGSGTAGLCTISADGSVVAFTSSSFDLDEQSGQAGAFLYDRATGSVSLAAPFQYPGDIQTLSLSSDGRFLAFSSDWSYPGTSDSGGFDVFVYDRNTATTTLVSHAEGASTTAVNQDSALGQISADGRFVVFSSRAATLAPGMSGSTQNVFLYELATGAVMLVSHAGSSPGMGGDADSGAVAVSADGSYVLFSSAAGNLVAGMTDANGSATPDLFLYERASGTVTLVNHADGSATTTANSGNGFYLPRLSATGRYVVFTSPATDLVAGQVDASGSFDVFLYDRVAGTSSLVSRTAGSPTTAQGGAHTGMSADGGTVSLFGVGGLFLFDRVTGVRVLVNHASGSPQTPANAGALGDAFGHTPVSADGRYVTYLSAATDLVAGTRDLNGDKDVFVFDRDTGANAIASASPPSMTLKTPIGTSEAKAISADGRFTVFVSTSRQLLSGPQSGNGSRNVFLRDRLAGTTTLVSRSSAGAQTGGNGDSDFPAISADGRFVAFSSKATDLVPGMTDANGSREDVFLYDRLTGTTSLVSRAAGQPTTTGSYSAFVLLQTFPHLSADGRFVLYASHATNLVQGQTDANDEEDIFLFDRQTGSTTLVSHAAASPTTTGDSGTFISTMSSDGRWIAFISGAGNLVPGQSGFYANLFLFDRISGEVTLVSHAAGSPSEGGNSDSNLPDLSADGRYLSFVSEAYNLVPGQIGGMYRNIYLYDRVTGTTILVSHAHSSASTTADEESFIARISADGRFIAFLSAADNLIPGQAPENPAQIFLYDHLTGTTTLAVEAPPATEDFAGILMSDLKISADGRFIAFTQALDYERGGLFLYDRLSGSTTLASHTPGAPDTAGNGVTLGPSISARGDFVAFTSSSTDLAPGDFNDATDAFLYVNPLPSGRDFHTLTPCRVLDTRQPQDGPALASGQAETLSLHGVCGIPATAKAVAVNVTVTQPTGAGHLSFAPGDLGDPIASTINFGPGQTRANNAILSLALNGTGTLRVSPAITGNGSVHVILDVVGYFE